MNKTLAIVIPTFQRSEILNENFILMLEEIVQYSIPIYISDDSVDVETENLCKELKESYPYVFYFKNSPSLGHDKNILKCFSLPKTNYVWLLGDSIIIRQGAIKKILNTIDKTNNEIISINVLGRDIDFLSDSYDNHDEIISNLGWHLTLTGATIYSQNVINLTNEQNFKTYSNFPQFSLIFHYLSSNCSFYWINDTLIHSHGKKNSYWLSKIFSVFIDDWSKAVLNLPSNYNDTILESVITDHSLKTNIFSLKSMLLLRSYGYYDWAKYRKYKKILPNHSRVSSFSLCVIALLPIFILRKSLFILRKSRLFVSKLTYKYSDK